MRFPIVAFPWKRAPRFAKRLFVSYSPEQDASESDVDDGFGTVDALFVVAHEAAPAGHPGERALDDPSTRDDFEAHGGVGSLDDLDGEIPEGGFVHELGAIIGPIGEQMLQPRPALATPSRII